MKVIYFIGIVHFIHSPLLVFVFVNNYVTNVVYVNYFLGIMFLYTVLNGECPISYVCKKMIDTEYVAGENITHYPEIMFLPEPGIHYYFGITTIVYLLTLVTLVNKTTWLILFMYFIFMQNQSCWAFFYFQEFTKCFLFFSLCQYLVGKL